jgi:hypothetical protein
MLGQHHRRSQRISERSLYITHAQPATNLAGLEIPAPWFGDPGAQKAGSSAGGALQLGPLHGDPPAMVLILVGQ